MDKAGPSSILLQLLPYLCTFKHALLVAYTKWNCA